jgi:hypothetical protein
LGIPLGTALLAKRKVRDIYGNWVWEDIDDEKNQSKSNTIPSDETQPIQPQEELKLEWRDYAALMWASLETYLLPIVIFIIILFVLAVVVTHL